MNEKEDDIHAYLKGLPPEDRSRVLRSSGLLGLSEFADYMPMDDSEESRINRAIVDPAGDDEDQGDDVPALTTEPKIGDVKPAGQSPSDSNPDDSGPTTDDLPHEAEGSD